MRTRLRERGQVDSGFVVLFSFPSYYQFFFSLSISLCLSVVSFRNRDIHSIIPVPHLLLAYHSLIRLCAAACLKLIAALGKGMMRFEEGLEKDEGKAYRLTERSLQEYRRVRR